VAWRGVNFIDSTETIIGRWRRKRASPEGTEEA